MSKPLLAWLQSTIFVSLLIYVPSETLAVDADDDANKAPDATLLHERVLGIPGDPSRPVTLQVTMYTPSGTGPFPLVVMNHGANGGPPAQAPRYRYTFSAYYFLSRGYAVALPMMRGFAGSGGGVSHHGCDLAATGIDNAKDIRAVIDYFTAQPEIDGEHIVVAGQSFGGWNTLAFGTLNAAGIKGLINFAGGVLASDCPTSALHLPEAAAAFGSHTTLPSIWFYGANDKVFSESTWREIYNRYTAAGGPAGLIAYGPFMSDSHNLLGSAEGLSIWIPKVDAFLATIGMPHELRYPQYLPIPRPSATQFAPLDDVNAVPYINDRGRTAYREFLNRPLPRVFLISGNGGFAALDGGFDPLGRGLSACRKAGIVCHLYAIDNDVVWSPPQAPKPTHFAELTNIDAVPFITVSGRDGYQKFLALPSPRAFVVATDGGWSAVARRPNALELALLNCAHLHQECRPYAVDNDVVWVP